MHYYNNKENISTTFVESVKRTADNSVILSLKIQAPTDFVLNGKHSLETQLGNLEVLLDGIEGEKTALSSELIDLLSFVRLDFNSIYREIKLNISTYAQARDLLRKEKPITINYSI